MRPAAALYGHGAWASGQVDQWLDACALEWEPIRQGLLQEGEQFQRLASGGADTFLTLLDHHLLSCTFVVGHAVTIADVSLALSVQAAVQVSSGTSCCANEKCA